MTMFYPIVLETADNGAVSACIPALPVYAAADSADFPSPWPAERRGREPLAESGPRPS